MNAAPLARAGVLLALFLGCVSEGCVSEEPAHRSMVPFRANEPVGITPERVAGTDRGDYALQYVLSDDGESIRLQLKGPSEPLTAGFATETRTNGDEHVLFGRIGHSDYRVPLARWKLDARRKVVDAWVRDQPIVEIRPIDAELKPGQLAAECEWRPWVDGKGVGEWRR
jgi:hypothetical protein